MNNQINYIELKSTDISKTKSFYGDAFGWTFTDYGPDYISFEGAGIDGGFELISNEVKNGVLVILYHDDLESIIVKVKSCGGKISKEIFSFPGGRRFHFIDPSGNELAIWSDKGLEENE